MKALRYLSVPLIIVVASAFFSNNASAKTPDEKISAIEARIDDMQKTYLSNNASAASAIAGVQGMKEEWNQAKGQIDANRHMLKVHQEEVSKVVADLDHRVQAIEERLQIFSNQLSKALAKVAPETAAEGDMYQKGLDLASEAKYLEAAAMFEKFIRKYDRSPYTPSAYYWIGESFYSMRDYQRAAKEFQRYVEKYPGDKNIASAIFKQGNCFYELGLLEESKAFYSKVMNSYPSSPEALQAKEKLSRVNEKQKGGEPQAGSFGSYPNETIEQRQQRLKGPQQKPAEESSPKKKVDYTDY